MSILTFFEPGLHGEVRHNLPLPAAQVGVVVRGAYYLLPAVDERGEPLGDACLARQLAARLMGPPAPGGGLTALTALARVQRSALPGLRALLSADTLANLDALRTAPLLINLASPGGTGSLNRNPPAGQLAWPLGFPGASTQPLGRRQLLGRVRLGERGLGDHPLTIFDSGSALVFDVSARLFDAGWACTLAEIFSLLAAQYGTRLGETPTGAWTETSATRFAAQPLPVRFQQADADLIAKAPVAPGEACAEVDSVQLRPALQLRALCKQNPNLPQLAVNDLLVLYRALHAVTYRPPASLINELSELQRTPNPSSRTGALIAAAARQSLETLQVEPGANPTLLLCFDASPRRPAERLRPVAVQVPVAALDLVNLHQGALLAAQKAQLMHSSKTGVHSGKPGAHSGKPGAHSGKPGEHTGRPGASIGSPGAMSWAAGLADTGPQAGQGLPAAASAQPSAGMPAPDSDQAHAAYLEVLGAFGSVMRRLRDAALLGESPFVEEDALPERVTRPLAGMLRTLPGRYDLFAELLDGDELFTNLGMAAPASSLTRFLPARDDDPRRSMVWGVLTSASGVMHITLRDFRPHVSRLHAAGLRDLADRIAQDYLNAYARGFNRFVYDLTMILKT